MACPRCQQKKQKTQQFKMDIEKLIEKIKQSRDIKTSEKGTEDGKKKE
jgi:hypothetical protein